MPSTTAAQTPTQRLHSLNHQAQAMIRLGIPLDLGLENNQAGEASIHQLEQINQLLNSETAPKTGSAELGRIDEMLKRHSFPDRYRSIAKLLLTASDPTPVFRSLSNHRPDDQSINRPIARAFTQPLIVLSLAFLGLIFLCVFVLPQIESQYEQVWQEPTGVTATLLTVRDFMPWWIIATPILILLAFFLLKSHLPKFLLGVLPGGSKYLHWLESASQTNRLAAVIDSEHSTKEAIAIAQLDSDTEQGKQPIIDAILHESPQANRAESLLKLSNFYSHLAKTRHRQYFTGIPMFVGILFAGIVVLIYALATFLPWIEMLAVLGDRRFEQ